jgi:hypothetical protein
MAINGTTVGIDGTTVGVSGVDVALDTASLRFDFFLSWARNWGMLGYWQVFACELHAALMCAFELDELADGTDQPDAIRAVATRYRNAAHLIDATAGRIDPVEQWPAFYNALWAGRHQLGGRLDVAAARVSAPPPWGIAKVDQAGWGMPFPVGDWLSRTTFHRAMRAIHTSCPLDDWPRLHDELRTTPRLDLVPEHADASHPAQRRSATHPGGKATSRSVAGNGTATVRPGPRVGRVPRDAVVRTRHRHSRRWCP